MPISFAAVAGPVLLNESVGGFMALFPVVGVPASYQNRHGQNHHGLWEDVRWIPVVKGALPPPMITPLPHGGAHLPRRLAGARLGAVRPRCCPLPGPGLAPGVADSR